MANDFFQKAQRNYDRMEDTFYWEGYLKECCVCGDDCAVHEEDGEYLCDFCFNKMYYPEHTDKPQTIIGMTFLEFQKLVFKAEQQTSLSELLSKSVK